MTNPPITVEEYVRREVDRAPMLTPEQRDQLAAILGLYDEPDDFENAA